MRVLVATDGSSCADVAVDLVAAATWPEGSTVHVVQAVESGGGLAGYALAAEFLTQSESLEEDLRHEADTIVQRTVARLREAGLTASGVVLRGRPADAVAKAATDVDADLIVLGSRGHGAIERMLLGSVSSEVVDRATVPVLVARATGLGRVVLAWDGSACARIAADLLRDWSIFAASRIRVIGVADLEVPWWTGFPVAGSLESMTLYADSAEVARRHHEELARAMAAELVLAGRDAAPEVREGDAATELVRASSASTTDLLVMGTHGRTGLTRLVMGSVARNVLQHAECSVLIAPYPSRQLSRA